MRLLKIFILLSLLTCLSISCVSTTRYTVTPRRSVVVTKIHNPSVIIYKNTRYYYSKGHWYTKNRKGYIVTNPPNGLVITTLPKGYRTVTIKKQKYYTYNGIYYRKNGKKYIVVNV